MKTIPNYSIIILFITKLLVIYSTKYSIINFRPRQQQFACKLLHKEFLSTAVFLKAVALSRDHQQELQILHLDTGGNLG